MDLYSSSFSSNRLISLANLSLSSVPFRRQTATTFWILVLIWDFVKLFVSCFVSSIQYSCICLFSSVFIISFLVVKAAISLCCPELISWLLSLPNIVTISRIAHAQISLAILYFNKSFYAVPALGRFQSNVLYSFNQLCLVG